MPKRAPPDLPPDLLNRLGPPEDVFGPNTRFLAQSTALGVLLVLMGFAGFVGGAAQYAERQTGAPIYMYLGGALMAVGSAAVILPRKGPRTWVYVCPRGLARARGENWEAVGWDQVARFQDATIEGQTSGIRQCRVILTDGTEWGFIENHLADYRRLKGLLRAKVDGPESVDQPGA